MNTGRTIGYVTDDDGSITAAYAAGGETNLDSVIDILEIANFLSSARFDSWIVSKRSQGDFNYDGIVDILDALEFLASGLLDVGTYIPPLASAPSTDAVSLNAAARQTTLVEAAPASTATDSTLSALKVAFAALATDTSSTGRPAKKLAFAKLA